MQLALGGPGAHGYHDVRGVHDCHGALGVHDFHGYHDAVDVVAGAVASRVDDEN